MPEVIFNGPEGRLEGRFVQNKEPGAPIANDLHPLPQLGGSMNNPVAYQLYHQFANRGFSVLRFNFRGVGRSQGEFDEGIGELSDAAAALDWLQTLSVDASQCWIAGYSFGAWIGMQLLDASAGNFRLHLGRSARQFLRFHLSRPLPVQRTDCAWRCGPHCAKG